MTSPQSNIHQKIKKDCSKLISLENQQEWSRLESRPDYIETMEDGRTMTLYITSSKSFYCHRKILEIEGLVYSKDTLIDVFTNQEIKVDLITIEDEPKKFKPFILAVIKGYSITKFVKEIFNKFDENEEEILNKYTLAKRVFKDYLNEVLEVIEESL